MQQLIAKISDICVGAKIVDENDYEWFCYALEKRLTSLITASFFLLIAVTMTDVVTAAAYLGSFYYLRTRTNGYHAKSFVGCICISLSLETTFLKFFLPILNVQIAIAINCINLIIVILFSPFNHPSMHMSREEIEACRMSARRRVLWLTAVMMLAYLFRMAELANGIVLGNTMAALLLSIANIRVGVISNGKSERTEEYRSQSSSESNG